MQINMSDNINNFIKDGKYIELEEILNAREKRAFIQKDLIEKYQLPLISFTLNIVGPVKVFPLSIKAYEEGIQLIKNQCSSYNINIVHTYEIREATGYEAFFVTDSDPLKIKKSLCNLEELISIGRVFDIDVIKTDGIKVSRTETGLPERKCLMCSNNAFVCSRSRAHSVSDLLAKECEIMSEYFIAKYADYISNCAVKALLYEVSASPKPGLVDRFNSGSHKDMDFYTFQNSSLALADYFKNLVVYGAKYCKKTPVELFNNVRPIGILAEKKMYIATNNINTHKGMIFSLGILSLAIGYMYGNDVALEADNLRSICKEMTVNLMNDFRKTEYGFNTMHNAEHNASHNVEHNAHIEINGSCDADDMKQCYINDNTIITNGERLHMELGITGIRGEAHSGYPTLFETALPFLKDYMNAGFSANDAGILTLLHIIANTVDTNIISRSSYETMCNIQSKIALILKDDIENKDYTGIIHELDKEFIELNISPGGSADLLALAYFLYFLGL